MTRKCYHVGHHHKQLVHNSAGPRGQKVEPLSTVGQAWPYFGVAHTLAPSV